MEDKTFNLIEKLYVEMKQEFSKVNGKVDNLEGRFDNLEGRFDNLEGRIVNLEKGQEEIKEDLASVKKSQVIMEQKIDDYKVITVERSKVQDEVIENIKKDVEDLKMKVG